MINNTPQTEGSFIPPRHSRVLLAGIQQSYHDAHAQPTVPIDTIRAITLKLVAYCQAENWAGYDPYDALNSRLFAATPFSRSRICRIAFTQLLKRLPINLRPLLLIEKEQNPKALALFLMSFLRLSKLGFSGMEELIQYMIERLVALRSPGTPYWCWGYSFPWQTRTILVPRGAPNLVCTTFVANALLDAHEQTGESQSLEMAVSAAEYLLGVLYWEKGDTVAGFSYPLPSSRSRVHNANFLGAALLCRIAKATGAKKYLEPALKAARYSASRQRDDGSWVYGELPTQQWVDNFHTGYNLCALRTIGQCAATSEFEPHVSRGFQFYRQHFFREDGAPQYFHDRTYPIDIHCVAQSLITLLSLQDLDRDIFGLACAVFGYAVKEMGAQEGYFYYQVLPLIKDSNSYMRWSQAWMVLALAMLLEYSHQSDNGG